MCFHALYWTMMLFSYQRIDLYYVYYVSVILMLMMPMLQNTLCMSIGKMLRSLLLCVTNNLSIVINVDLQSVLTNSQSYFV